MKLGTASDFTSLVASGISRTALPSNQCPRKSLSEEILHAVDEVLWPANLFGKAGADLNFFLAKLGKVPSGG